MLRLFGVQSVIVRTVFAFTLCGLIACQPTDQPTDRNGGGAVAAPTQTHATNEPSRDLTQDEAAGGHILRKHVGQTEQQLRDRLERERNITGASTYTDLSTAEHAVGAAIAQSQGQIQRWLDQPGRHSNLALDYDSDVPIGRTMNRGEHQSRICEHAVVVLKYTGPNHYYVLTSYPECRS